MKYHETAFREKLSLRENTPLHFIIIIFHISTSNNKLQKEVWELRIKTNNDHECKIVNVPSDLFIKIV